MTQGLASGFANADLAISITLVNEQVPARRGGLLYSIVQGGWPVGVLLASGVYLPTSSHGWRFVFTGGLIVGSLLWTALVSVTSASVTWLIIAVGIGCLLDLSTLALPKIRPGRELEELVT